MLLEKRSDLPRIVPDNLLEDRHQYAAGIVADDRRFAIWAILR